MTRRPAAPGGVRSAATAALALLVLCCVFMAVAGPRASLGIRTRALRSTLTSAPPPTRAIVASVDAYGFSSALAGQVGAGQGVTAAQVAAVQDQLTSAFLGQGVPLGPRAAAWSGMTTPLAGVPDAAASAQADAPPRIEVLYRDPLGRNARLVAGRFPGDAPGRGAVGIAVSQQTAARFSLRPGSRLEISSPAVRLRLVVTGVIRPSDPGGTFWTADSLASRPVLIRPAMGPTYWIGAVFAGGGGIGTVQHAYGPLSAQLTWQLPLSRTLGGVDADHVQAMQALLNRVTRQTPALRGPLSQAAPTLVLTTTETQLLASFLATQDSVATLLSLLFTGLTVIGAVVLALAVQMVTARRAASDAVLRARGASMRQAVLAALRGAVLAVVPAAAAGAAAAVALTPGGMPPLSLWLAGVTVLAALAGPPLAAAARYRASRSTPAGPAQPGGAPPAGPLRRWVAEIALAAAAAGGLVVLRSSGLSPGGGFNAYASAAPVLVAVLAALCVLRLYPLVLRGALWLSGRGRGVTGYLAAARAARAPAASVLPVFALVLALTLAAFAGMVRDAVGRGEAAASWRATGADAVVSAALTPAAVRALAAVPGVRHAAAVSVMTGTMPGGRPVTVVAVDPAGYAALVASTPWPRFSPARLGPPGGVAPGRGPVPVLASPAAAAALGAGTAQLQPLPGAARPAPALRVRRAGVVAGTPAVPAGGAFVILPSRAIAAGAREPDLMLMTGPGLDETRLLTVARRLAPGATVRFRRAGLAALAGAALPRGAYLAYGAGLAAAAGFSVVTILLDLVLGAADRERTLARLATMGLGSGQARLLTLLGALPAVLAAAAAGAASAWALAPLTGPALNLAVFTGSAASVLVRPDFAALGLPVAGLVVLAAGTLLVQVRAARRRGVTRALRMGS